LTSNIDFALWPDVITEVSEHLPLLERELHQLVATPQSPDLLASAFRRMHTMKGDFGYCQAMPIMEYMHRLENVMQSLRDQRFLCSPFVAEALIQSMDQVQEMMQSVTDTGQYDDKPRDKMMRLIDRLGVAANQAEADNVARSLLLAAHDSWVEDEVAPAVPPTPAGLPLAMALGRQLAAALAVRMPAWDERVKLQTDVVLALNAQYRHPCNADSLTLAVVWHDVGMLALPDACFTQMPKPKSPEWPRYAAHPGHAADWLLTVAPDCTDAAQMIRQHHQWANGFGIRAADDGPVHPGAMMIACADLLADNVLGQDDEGYRRGVLRTLFDVNGGLDTRFDVPLINAFEVVARKLVADMRTG